MDQLPLDYWLLHNNPKLNLDLLLQLGKPKRVIIDGSKSPYYIEQWKKSLTQYNIPYHITKEKGALALNREIEEQNSLNKLLYPRVY